MRWSELLLFFLSPFPKVQSGSGHFVSLNFVSLSHSGLFASISLKLDGLRLIDASVNPRSAVLDGVTGGISH